jgi:membrane-associated PAP2 superfamily phosphatase
MHSIRSDSPLPAGTASSSLEAIPMREARSHAARALWITVAFLITWGLIRALGIDARVEDLFFDPATGTFPARQSFWVKNVLHDGGDSLIAAIELAAFGWLVAGIRWAPARRHRRRALFVLLSFLATATLVHVIRHLSAVDCPWNAPRYGGTLGPPTLADANATSLARGRCFPAAHSSGAFSLLAFALLARGWRARALCAGVLGLGVVFAATQWSRGAHFVSHDLFSAWIAALVCLGLHALLFPANGTSSRRR